MLYGALFFDRLAPLYLVGVVGRDLAIPTGTAGALPLGIGIGWAVAMLLSQRVARRLAPRERMIAAAGITAVLGIASAATGGWAVFVLLRSIAGVASGLAAPAVTSLTYAVAPPHRRGRDLGVVQSSTRLLGSLASPVVVTWIAVVEGWRPALVASAGLLAAATVIFAVLTSGERPAAPCTGVRPAAATPPVLRRGGLVHVASGLLLAWSAGADLALPAAVVAVLFALAGVAMGTLPLVLSIVPAEAVSRGDVGQALRVPIVTGELVGGALLPAIALAGWISEAVSVGVVAVALLATSAASLRLRPLA